MRKEETKRKGKGKRKVGLLLITAAFLLVIYNMWEEAEAQRSTEFVRMQIQDKWGKLQEKREEIQMQEERTYSDAEMPMETIDGREYIGVLEIPAYELILPVISQWSYAGLKTAPCRYTGSVYSDDLIIAAHNYSAHFGRLKDLKPGEKIIFTDMAGEVFTYEVKELKVLLSEEVKEMESGDWELTLFTCTLGGRYRVTVRCERVYSESKLLKKFRNCHCRHIAFTVKSFHKFVFIPLDR